MKPSSPQPSSAAWSITAPVPSPTSPSPEVGPATLHELPDEVLEDVLGHLELPDLARAQGLDHRLQRVALSPALPLMRNQVLHRASLAAQHAPPALAGDEVRAIFQAHLAQVGGRRAMADALDWLVTLATQGEAAVGRHAACEGESFVHGLLDALEVGVPGYAVVAKEMQASPKVSNVAHEVAANLGGPELADEVADRLRGPILRSLAGAYADLVVLRDFGADAMVDGGRQSRQLQALSQRLDTEVQRRIQPLWTEFSGSEAAARRVELERRLMPAQRDVFVDLQGRVTRLGLVDCGLPPDAPAAWRELEADLGAYLFASMAEPHEVALLRALDSPACKRMVTVQQQLEAELKRGRLRRLGEAQAANLMRAIRAGAPRLTLVHALELATRPPVAGADPAPNEAASRRRELATQLSAQLSVALAQVQEHWPAAPQAIVDFLSTGMEGEYAALRNEATAGADEAASSNPLAELVRAIAVAWPEVEPTPLAEM